MLKVVCLKSITEQTREYKHFNFNDLMVWIKDLVAFKAKKRKILYKQIPPPCLLVAESDNGILARAVISRQEPRHICHLRQDGDRC